MEEINVFIKLEDGKLKTIKAKPDYTLKQFVSQMKKDHKIRIEGIAFDGKLFKPYQYNMTLNELGIKDKSYMQIMIRFPGG